MNDLLARLFGPLHDAHLPETEEPIRSELFSIERLEQHGESLAEAQRVRPEPVTGRALSARLEDNGRVLLQAYRKIAEAINAKHVITPAAEWLVDNFHIVDEQIREIHDDLPPGYYRLLPKLAEGPLEGYPRVFGIAWAFVAHTDSRFDLEMLSRFVGAYQRIQPLTIGELWAVAITLRVVLVENLRRSAERIISSRTERQEADAASDRLLGVGPIPPEPVESAFRLYEGKPLPRAFAVQIVQRLRDKDPAVTPALRWLDARLAAQHTTSEQMVTEEHQFQGAISVTVRNIITSMRLISAVDWTKFFEGVSLVDAMLREGSNFSAMDFPTRDSYRHAIEELARGSSHTEREVARCALRNAEHAAIGQDGLNAPQSDPGYYLLSNGRRAFERQLAFHVSGRMLFERAARHAGIWGYLGAAAAVSAGLLALPIGMLAQAGVGAFTLAMLTILAIIPFSDAAFALVNHWITHRLAPRTLPALSLHDGVPDELRTMIVMPMLLTTREEIEEQIERLEVHFLANQDGELYFALLSDWRDASSEHVDGDEELLCAAEEGIARLNQRHERAASGERFLLLHRRRLWNEGEKKWMGWERKRGKLHEFNRLVRGATDTSFLDPPRLPADLRFVITLDADTRFPRRAARRLVGKMAHPLNRPRLDAHTGRVIEGYGVLQPRVTPSLPTDRGGSFFQHLFSGPGGMDPYAFAVSDVYQDLFGKGSYSGKGIYDIEVFEAALAGRVPENAVLSHDLLEGIFAGAGLVTDIDVVEEYPTRYDVAAARQHRWARGDWQLLPWILGSGRDASGQAGRRQVPLIGRWKMMDNLRRSLSAPAAFCALVAGWRLPPASAAVWSLCIVATIALPTLLPFFSGLLPRRSRQFSKRSHVRAVAKDLLLALAQTGFHLSLLAHQAWLMGDAVVRTLFRLFASHRHLLEWMTAAQAKFGLPLSIPGFYRRMAGGVALAGVAGLSLLSVPQSGAWQIAAPFVVLWLLSPLTAQRTSRPRTDAATEPLSIDEAQTLRLIARRTWRYFETFVTAEDHLLPPDNFQEEPTPKIAHRTSPTNLGLYLLSTVAANDFGWQGSYDTTARIESTLSTLNTLERFRGHFYNWYDTQSLRALDPKYVSSVDSGNLAGHLIALGNACMEMLRRPAMDPRHMSGIGDALLLARESLQAWPNDGRSQAADRRQLEQELGIMSALLASPPSTPEGVMQVLGNLSNHAALLDKCARGLVNDGARGPQEESGAELVFWMSAIRASVNSHERDAELLKPWQLLAEAATHNPALLSASLRAALGNGAIPTLDEIPECCDAVMPMLSALFVELRSAGNGTNHGNQTDKTGVAAVEMLIESFDRSGRAVRSLRRRLLSVKEDSMKLFALMDFTFLFDDKRRLLSLGCRAADGSLDPSCYDLLASEARLASFVAIAKGDVPMRHWFALGRALTPVDRDSALISWSGSMFEYLMPALVMRTPAESLLGQTARCVVRRQIEYGKELDVPWGVSESAYNVRDLELIYQYSTFGVPGLGLKRGLSKDAVIAPYATGLAAMIDPKAALRNFLRLAGAGGRGKFGYFEALDYTPSRLPEGSTVAIVRAYMAHHQGMTLTAIGNVLYEGRMQQRFHTEPIIQATELLLQERMPRGVAVARPRGEEVKSASNIRMAVPSMYRRMHSAHDDVPHTHILSNGNYAVMMTGAGSGYSRWRDIAVTRWREDVTMDAWGAYIYLRDRRRGDVWSAAYQPTCVEPGRYEVEFSEDRIEIARDDGTITTTLEVTVSPENDAEVRRISLSNLGTRVREIELTSYAEVVLAPPASDTSHPAFSKLFVQTEFVADVGTLLATRRRRSPTDPEIWAAHLAVIEGESIGALEYETDRARFIGRGCDVRSPRAVMGGGPLSNTAGTVLDPVFSLRCCVRIPPGTTVHVAFWTMVAPTRQAVLDLADKHYDASAFERALTLAWTQAQVQLYHLAVSAEEAHLFQQLAGHILYANPSLRPPSDVLLRNAGGPSALWAHRISGDLPIVLVRIDDPADMEIVRQLVRAHEYWRMKLLAVDLVILNEQLQSYLLDLQGAIETVVRTNESQMRPQPDGRFAQGNIFIVRADLMSLDERMALQCAARAVLMSRRGSLAEQLLALKESESAVPPQSGFSLRPHEWVIDKLTLASAGNDATPAAPAAPSLEFSNGAGGFAAKGREYVTILSDDKRTPAPWINVIANASFGFQVSADGSGYTWSQDSRENQLTPWMNDPVGDRPGEVFYLRDEHSGRLWCPTALPVAGDPGDYIARHGQGYSRFEHRSHGIAVELLEFVPLADPIKISRMTIKNVSRRNRRLSVTAYLEWVLAVSREASAPFVTTEIEPQTQAMLARNPWRMDYQHRVAFADLSGRQTSWTGDRKEFLGRNGTLAHPVALESAAPLSTRVGAGMDPCCAMQTLIDLKPDEEAKIVFLLGDAAGTEDARRLILRYRAADLDAVFQAVTAFWNTTLGALQVKTPDRAMDILLNRWLLYQTIACRVWARSAFYQASGAYGFRDQLQDGMALAASAPELTRNHLLRAAG
ncbi:MAG: GH36-type glycosyl hydrolase domain-containing protein, partial [Acidobacteriota bacterium]